MVSPGSFVKMKAAEKDKNRLKNYQFKAAANRQIPPENINMRYVLFACPLILSLDHRQLSGGVAGGNHPAFLRPSLPAGVTPDMPGCRMDLGT